MNEDFCNYNFNVSNNNNKEFVYNIENRQLNFDQIKKMI